MTEFISQDKETFEHLQFFQLGLKVETKLSAD
jgi:hypothetical protein